MTTNTKNYWVETPAQLYYVEPKRQEVLAVINVNIPSSYSYSIMETVILYEYEDFITLSREEAKKAVEETYG